jgi:hypothetical protein
VLTTRAVPGSLPSTTAPAKLSGCTSSPITRPRFFAMILFPPLVACLFMLYSLDARRGRLLTNSLPTQTSGAELARRLARSMRVHPSDSFSAQSGKSPLHRSSPAGSCLALVLFPSPIARYQNVRSRLASSSQSTFPQRTACNAATDVFPACHPSFGCLARCTGLAVADLMSR